ncbi:MAG: hypothetical protein INR73_25850 [Williamsia sp.]|nr:hypothetical protein [Williamsia sp.]
MNATYSMDHLQAVAHVGAILNATNANAGGAAVNRPKTANTSHYDATGQTVATASTTSYEGVSFGSDGSITGGSLSHQSVSPEGIKLHTTAVNFQADGKPASASIDVHNLHSDGDFKKIAMDLSGATWNDGYNISSGQVKVTATDPNTQATLHEGTIQFDKEALVSGSFTHYDPQNGGAVSGHAEIDYAGAKFLGTSIVGGQYSIRSLNPDKTLSATSVVSVSPLGRLDSVETTNVGPDSAVKTKVKVDFSKVQFNARNEFDSGDLLYTVQDDKGTKLSETAVTYKGAVPSLSQTLVYQDNALSSKIMIDYTGAAFNNQNQVVNSSKKVDVYGADNKLVSSSMVTYDERGQKLKPGAAAKVHGAPAPPARVPVPVLGKAFALPPADPNQTQQTDKKNRPDGTLQQVRVTTLVAGKPVSALVTAYAADGTTVVKTYTLDLTGISFDENAKTVSGALNMQTHLGGNILHAASSIQY